MLVGGTFTINQGGANTATMQIIGLGTKTAGATYNIIEGNVQGNEFIAYTVGGAPPPLGYDGTLVPGSHFYITVL
jgi:hypothetical protein